jgi:hypothetical protein
MTKRLACGLGVVGLLISGLAVSGRATFAQATPRPLCSGPDSGAYSAGAIAKFGEDRYRCLYVFGEKLAPAGVAWVKLQANSSSAPKEPTEGR